MGLPVTLADAIERGRDDIAFFALYFFDVILHDGQKRWCEGATRKINVLVPGNRWGKTTVSAIKHLHRAFYKKGEGWARYHFRGAPFTREQWLRAKWESINVSISQDQANLVFAECIVLCSKPKFKPFVKGMPVTPFPAVNLVNGSTIHFRSTGDNGKYIDGHRYAYMTYDEAGWEAKLGWLIGTVLLVRLTDWAGCLDLIGTPKGRGDLFKFKVRGDNGDPEVYTQIGGTRENPFLDVAEIDRMEEELNRIDPKLARQAIYGEFIEQDGLCFTWDQLQGNMVRPDQYPIEMDRVAYGVRYRVTGWEPSPNRRYAAAFDLARKKDRTVGAVLDISRWPFVIVEGMALTRCPWETQYGYIGRVARDYDCVPLIDGTGIGDVVDEELTKRGIPHECFNFGDGTGRLKERLITNLQNALDLGRPDEADEREMEWGLLRSGLITPMLDELSTYDMNDKKLETDWVMALAMAVWKAWRTGELPAATRGPRRRPRAKRR